MYRNEKVVYCGYLVNHWGHFLVEAVNRLWYALREDPSIDKYVFFVDENEERIVKGNYREFFQLLNIWDKLEIVNRPTTFQEYLDGNMPCLPEHKFQIHYIKQRIKRVLRSLDILH